MIKEYHSIHRLKKQWNRLYLTAESVSNPFLSFIPNLIYYRVFHLSLHRIHLKPRFIYFQEGTSQIILPIIVNQSEKRITEFAPLDYYDALSSGSHEFLLKVMNWIKAHYTGYSIRFTRVNQDSALSNLVDKAHSESERCVFIPYSNKGYEMYYQSLSKHQRQNIRTAYNKLEKEGISYSLSKDKYSSLPRRVKKQCQEIYEKRKSVKDSSESALKRIYHRISKPVIRILEKMEEGTIFILYLNGSPAAFLAGAYTRDRKSIVVPVLCSNNDFLRYSPGIMLINEVSKILINEGVEVLDLARGEEPYKYSMGGVAHVNYTISF